jgi:hypothetical protein
MQCPSKPQALNMVTGWANLSQVAGIPALCAANPPVSYISYNFNYAVIDDGDPNIVFGTETTRPAKTLAQIPDPVDTSLVADGVPVLTGQGANPPPGYCGLFDSPVDARHMSIVNSNYCDGHAKVVHARPALAANNNQYNCIGFDGQVLNIFVVTDQGPYQGSYELWGIPTQNANGTWSLGN